MLHIKAYFKYFFAITLYFFFLFLALFFFLRNNNPELLNSEYLLRWDARHYFDIKEIGYNDYRVAFFPLFPLFWKLSNLNNIGISIFNGLLFLLSISFVFYRLKYTIKETLLYTSIPSFCFMFVPYTESFFFLFSSLVLIGLKEKKYSFLYLGLFFAGLSRPTISIFLPSLIALLLYIDKKEIRYYIISVITTLIAILIVFSIQYIETREFLSFFNAQKLFWKNELQIPRLPFTTWEGHKILLLDSSALVFSIISGIFVVFFLIKKILYNQNDIDNHLLFSLLYVFGAGMIVLLYRGGSLYSLNRFVYASIFIIPTIYFITNFFYQNYFTLKGVIILFILMNGFFLLSGSYVHIQTFLKYFALSCYLFLFILQLNKNKVISILSYILILISNSILFCYLYYRFLSSLWVA